MRSFFALALLTLLIATFVGINMRETKTVVYVCSDPDLPPEIKKMCPKKTPRMENGCVIQEVHGREIRTCG
jgi:hypothetical protein